MESIRVIMLRNWHFDILNLEHWNIAWDLWLNSWVISEPKEWAFVLIIISFIPLWFTGWIALSLISWGKLVWFILTLPWKLFKNFFYKPVKIITTNTGVTPIKRKKSYKEIRPRAVRAIGSERSELSPSPISIPTVTPSLVTPKMTAAPQPVSVAAASTKPAPKNFEHALFKFDDNFDDLDFDIDAFEIEPNKKAAVKNETSNRAETITTITTKRRANVANARRPNAAANVGMSVATTMTTVGATAIQTAVTAAGMTVAKTADETAITNVETNAATIATVTSLKTAATNNRATAVVTNAKTAASSGKNVLLRQPFRQRRRSVRPAVHAWISLNKKVTKWSAALPLKTPLSTM